MKTLLATVNTLIKQSLIFTLVIVLSVPHAIAKPQRVKLIQLNPNFGHPVRLKEAAGTIAIGDPNIIDVVTVEPNLLMITGINVGATSLTVFGKSGAIYQYRAQVSSDLSQLRQVIRSLEPRVTVHNANGKVVLKGEVKTAAALTRVLTVADRYMGGDGQPKFNVVSDNGGVLAGNLTEKNAQQLSPVSSIGTTLGNAGGGGGRGGGGRGNQNGSNQLLDAKANLAQNIGRANVITVAGGAVVSLIRVTSQPKVEIQMRIVDIDRSITDKLGINWRLDGKNIAVGSYVGGTSNGLLSPEQLGDSGFTRGESDLVAFFTPGNYFISTFIKALEEKGATSTLSEPLLTAVSGESARFVVGGTVPVPYQETTSSTNSVAVSTNVRYLSYGLNIVVRPTVLENGKISMVLDQSLSELDYGNAIQILNQRVPGFTQKTVSTITESDSGETWAVAGLLSEEDRKSLRSVPWLSKVPVFGKLFENKEDASSRNEMIILVNARVIDEVNSTTTSFDGRGKLAPTKSAQRNLQSGERDEQDGSGEELNSHIPFIKAPSPKAQNKTLRTPPVATFPLEEKSQGIIEKNTTNKQHQLPTATPSENSSSNSVDLPGFKYPKKNKKGSNVVNLKSPQRDELNSNLPEVTVTGYDELAKNQPIRILHLRAIQNENQADYPALNVEKVAVVNKVIDEAVVETNQPIVSKLLKSKQPVESQTVPVVANNVHEPQAEVNKIAANSDANFSPLPVVPAINNIKNLPTLDVDANMPTLVQTVDKLNDIEGGQNEQLDVALSSKAIETALNNQGNDTNLRGVALNFEETLHSQQKQIAVVNTPPTEDVLIANKDLSKKQALAQAQAEMVEMEIHNFLVGAEKDQFLNKLKHALKDDPKRFDELSKWRVAAGSEIDDQNNVHTFLVKPEAKSQVYSGAVVKIAGLVKQEYLVMVDEDEQY